MKYSKTQAGFAAVEAFLVLVVLAILGFAGYKVFNAKSTVDQTDENVSSSQSSSTSVSKDIPVVNSTDDLNKVQQSLDKENPDDTAGDSAQLDGELAAF